MQSSQTHALGLYICGSDTAVGKTHFAAALALELQKSHTIAHWKPAQSGTNDCPDGIQRTDRDFCSHYGKVHSLASYTFEEPLAPHLAAQRQGIQIQASKLHEDFQSLSQQYEIVLCEGAGGILSPLLTSQCQADFFYNYCQYAILVARDGLGTINHTLLSIEALRARGFKVLGFVFGSPCAEDFMAMDNAQSIAQISQVPFWGYAPQLDQTWDLPQTSLELALQCIKGLVCELD